MGEASSKTAEIFAAYFRSEDQNQDRFATPGRQYIVQLLKGGYLGEDVVQGNGRPALNIGCGNGANLVSLHRMGWRAHGCDISEEILNCARQFVDKFGSQAELALGGHVELPYPDDSMDLVLAFNSLHYCETEEKFAQSLKELHRVTAPGGRVLIELLHQDGWLLEGTSKGEGRIRKISADDFRAGEAVYIFDNKEEIKSLMDGSFRDVQVAINTVNFFSRKLVNYVVTGVAV